MDWNAFGCLLIIVLFGYAPYKLLQRHGEDGLGSISPVISISLSLWFIVFSVLFYLLVLGARVDMSLRVIFIFCITTILWFCEPYIVPRVGIRPREQKKGFFLERLEPKTFYLKYFEVIFQQFNFLFVLMVVLADFPNELKIFWFVVIIGFFHIINIFFVPKSTGWKFFLLSIPMAALFSWVILNGLVLITASIHIWFYIVLAGYPWIKGKYLKNYT